MADISYGNRDKERAKQLYMQGLSLRSIAKQVLPESKGGYVTIQRWSTRRDPDTGLTWQDERNEVNEEVRAENRAKYLEIVSQVKDRNLQIAAKGMLAVDMALESFFQRDRAGNVIGIKLNHNGNPLITARDVAPLVAAMHTIQKETLRMDTVLDDEVTQVVAQDAPITIEASLDPELLKRLGDQLAVEALSAPVNTTQRRDDGDDE